MSTAPRLFAFCSPAMGSGKSTIARHLEERHGFEIVSFATPIKYMTSGLLDAIGMNAEEVRARVYGDRKEEPIANMPSLAARDQATRLIAIGQMVDGILEALGMDANQRYAHTYGVLQFTDVSALRMSVDSFRAELITFANAHLFVPSITSRRIQQLIGTEFGRAISEDFWVGIARSAIAAHRAAGRSAVVDDMRFPNELEAMRSEGAECWRIMRPGVKVTSKHASEGQLDDVQMNTLMNGGSVKDLLLVVDRVLSL